ncbi:RNA-binding protein 25-like [Cherax quadricarinatus]|uniref:RNA-binding protein 25-like n=1 Tax=Cherax quadricarinatus TaxID=27406 RepID=UPI00387E646A
MDSPAAVGTLYFKSSRFGKENSVKVPLEENGYMSGQMARLAILRKLGTSVNTLKVLVNGKFISDESFIRNETHVYIMTRMEEEKIHDDCPLQQEGGFPHKREGDYPHKRESDLTHKREGDCPRKREGDGPRKRKSDCPRKRHGDLPLKRKGNLPEEWEGDFLHKWEHDFPRKKENDCPRKRKCDFPRKRENDFSPERYDYVCHKQQDDFRRNLIDDNQRKRNDDGNRKRKRDFHSECQDDSASANKKQRPNRDKKTIMECLRPFTNKKPDFESQDSQELDKDEELRRLEKIWAQAADRLALDTWMHAPSWSDPKSSWVSRFMVKYENV